MSTKAHYADPEERAFMRARDNVVDALGNAFGDILDEHLPRLDGDAYTRLCRLLLTDDVLLDALADIELGLECLTNNPGEYA